MFKACTRSCGGGLAIGCFGCGNKILACCTASLIGFGEALNLILNSIGDKKFWSLGSGFG